MSSSIRFNKGRTFLLDGREVSVVRVINGDLVTLEDITSLVVYQHTKQQLLELWAVGRIVSKPVTTPSSLVEQNNTHLDTLGSYPQKLIDDALRRKKYLDALATMGEKIVFTPAKLKPLLTYIAQQLGDPEAPSTISIYRWFKRKLQHKDHPLALLEKPHARGWFGCRFPREVQEALIELIETRYLESPGCSIVDLRDALSVRIHDLNQLRTTDSLLQLPSYDTIRRAIQAYPAYEQAVAKFGKQEASIRFRTSLAGPTPKFILEATEVDHTPIDLFVVDEQTGMPLGRPWLTVIIDRKSRMILGIYVSFGGPSTEAVFGCLRNAILPKSYVHERYPRVEGEWPCYGLMEILVCDNGLEFHSRALEQACFALGIILQFCPKRKPYFKGMVERAFGSISRNFLHAQKGTSLANWMERHGYDPLKTAVATFDELMHALHIWIVDVYSVSFHRGLKRTPLGVWQDGIHDNPPALPDLKALEVALTEEEERVLWHYGIELFNLRYNSREIYPIRHQFGEKVTVRVRYHRADLGHVYVIHPGTGEAIKVPAVEFDYASGLRLEVHQLICQELREAGLSETNPLNRARAKERIRQVIGEQLASKKLSKRKRAARLSGTNSLLASPQRQDAEPATPKDARPTPPTVIPRQFKTSSHPLGKGGRP
ncbi:putative transposase [Chromobacterium alkanivorans]|uniref:DDE-type integrase/transposase/recombinase n=1 Tax=Chromobacterium TaxID=535 RepID=UPI0021692D9B|nr:MULTISPECIES: DDE-type integrase/transposase/recombinase [Chromobacterium]MCS3805041.1 putative transposase [Chromobacterium alkanivorans]MCS3819396.1 putative transposase [Chromobacterium alkanivorans]MCS3873908.1 putative transposase [Chromobacterium alkanivorans]MDH0341629.1 DDE-type integrase/transposase/recombinase [Chromobacterium haemolyticum]